MHIGPSSEESRWTHRTEGSASWAIHVDPAQSVAEIRAHDSGHLRIIRTIAEALVEHPQWRPGFDIVWDVTGLGRIVVAPEDVPGLLRIPTDFDFGPGRSAFVVENEDYYVLAQLLVARQKRETTRESAVFRSRDAAYEWLGKRPPAP